MDREHLLNPDTAVEPDDIPPAVDTTESTCASDYQLGAAAAAAGLFVSGAAMAQTAVVPGTTGAPGPGLFSGGLPDFTQTGVTGPETFDTFGCKVFQYNTPTPDWQTADVYFERKVFTNGQMTMPDGVAVTHWGFEDLLRAPGAKPFPSPLIRVKQNMLTHVRLDSRVNAHTIHHHGIEPTTMNDGVGHVSFEITGSYVYQWVPRHAGTFIYHCHKNTVLHFEMGLYGALIVDPPEGFGFPYSGATQHRYDIERLWVFDDFDARWHNTLEHDAGMCGLDVGLNIFRPKYFFINGVHSTRTPTDPSVAITALHGQRILIRMINAAYSVVRVRFHEVDPECVSMDGHALVDPARPWCSSYKFIGARPGVPRRTIEDIQMVTAQRLELWIDTSTLQKGKSYRMEANFEDWITRKRHSYGDSRHIGYATTYINVV